MKKSFLSHLLLLPFLLFIGVACDNSDDLDREGNPHNRKMIITVASEKFVYDDFEEFSPYWVKEDYKTEWTRFDGIKGFEHEAGYECTLEIWREKWHDGEIMDASIYRYKLLNILDKVKKDTENFPDQTLYIDIASKKTSDPANPYFARPKIHYEWEPFPKIEGFEYVEGNEYSLLIKMHFKGSEAPAKYTYSLVRIVKEETTDSF